MTRNADIVAVDERIDAALRLLKLTDTSPRRTFARQRILNICNLFRELEKVDGQSPTYSAVRDSLTNIAHLAQRLSEELNSSPVVRAQLGVQVDENQSFEGYQACSPGRQVVAKLGSILPEVSRAAAIAADKFKTRGGRRNVHTARFANAKAHLVFYCAALARDFAPNILAGTKDGPFMELVETVYEAATGRHLESGDGLAGYVVDTGSIFRKIAGINVPSDPEADQKMKAMRARWEAKFGELYD